MTTLRMRESRTGSLAGRRCPSSGFTLVETMIALVIVLVVGGGLASLYGVSLRSNAVNSTNVELLSAARAKLEQIQSIPYEQVGIRASGTPSGPGYFVFDPFAQPTYDPADDDLLSDTVALRNGTVITRTVTVTAVDDPADGVGSGDADGAVDPNTDTILDYKRVTVTAAARVARTDLTFALSTFIRGTLDVETDGSTGEDSDGSSPTNTKKVKKTKPIVPTEYVDGDGDTEVKAKKVKKAKK